MSPSRQRLIALGGLAVAIAAIWFAVISPIADAFADQGTRIGDLQQQLTAYDARIAIRPAVEMRLAELKQHEASSTGLIAGKSAELAAANIQNQMKAIVEGVSGQVQSAQNLPPVTAGGFERIEIQYDATVPMTRLKDLAYRVETSVPFLFLDGVDLRAPENWQGTGMPMDPPAMQVHWTVRGYRWTGAP